MTDLSEGLDVLSPPGVEVRFDGEALTITPLLAGEVVQLARAVRPLAQVLDRLGTGQQAFGSDLLIDLLADYGDDVLKLVAIASRVPLDRVQAAELDQLFELAQAVVAANTDFFRRRLLPVLLPALRRALVAIKPAATDGAGPIPSPS